jgi:hypothetical protein
MGKEGTVPQWAFELNRPLAIAENWTVEDVS